MKKRIDKSIPIIISCGAKKRDTSATGPIPARELYTGPLFKAALKAAESISNSVYILSAHYGLLQANDKVETYERKMSPKRSKQFQRELVMPHPAPYTILPKLYLACVPGARSLMVPGLKMGDFLSYTIKLQAGAPLPQTFPRRARAAKPISDK